MRISKILARTGLYFLAKNSAICLIKVKYHCWTHLTCYKNNETHFHNDCIHSLPKWQKRRWLLSVLICGKISAWEICPHPPAWRQPVEITRPTNMIHFMAFVATTPVRDRWQRQTLFFFSIIIFRLEQEEKSKSDLNKGEKSEPHLTKKMTRYSCLVFGHSLIFEQPHQSKNLGTVCVFRTAWECNQGVWSPF